MKTTILFIYLFLFCLNIFAQHPTKSIVGNVINSNSEPIEFANVVLLSYADSTFITGTYTDNNGNFSLDKLSKTDYLLKISFLGYKDYLKNITLSSDKNNIGDITLEKTINQLNEVVVTSKTLPFQVNSNGLIANISTTLLSGVGSATDVLQRIPGIIVEEGKITVFRKGTPIVYINNRKVRNNQELEQLESSDISTVELITNPDAKYDAEGRVVLLIKTRKKQNGFAAQVTERIRYGSHLGDNENINFSYTKNNLNLYTSYYHQYSKMKSKENHHILLNSDGLWEHEIDLPDYQFSNNSQQINAGFDWSLNKKQAIGGQYQLFAKKHENSTQANSITYLDNTWFDESALKTFFIENPYSHLFNVFYKGDYNDYFSLRFDFDYLKSHKNRNQSATEVSNLESKIITTFNQTDYDLYAEKLTNTYQSSIGTIEFGGEHNYIYGNGFVTNPDGYVDNNIFTNKEQKVAGFINYSNTFAGVNLSGGLRYEYTSEQFTEDSVQVVIIDRKYNNLYPNFSVSGKIKNLDISLAFNKRVQRPNFSELNGNTLYVNQFIFQKGNPYLKKTDIYDVNLQAIFQKFYLNLGYTYEKNPVVFFFEEQKKSSNAILSTYTNFPKHQEFNATFNVNTKIAFWQPNYTFNVCKPFFSSDYNGHKETYNESNYFFKAYNDFILPYAFVFSCNFIYRSNNSSYYIQSERFKRMDIALRKSFFEKQLRVNLDFYDIFDWVKDQSRMMLNSFYWDAGKKRETRYVQLSISYMFNNYKKKYRGENAAKNDINRF